MKQHRTFDIPESLRAVDRIIAYLNNRLLVPSKRHNLFVAFAKALEKDSGGFSAYANLHSACELLNDYLNTLGTYDRSDDTDFVKRTKKAALRTNLSLALQKCGAIGQCLDNDKILGSKQEVKNNLNQIDKNLIFMLFKLLNLVRSEKKQATTIDQEQLSQVEQLIQKKEYDLAMQWSQPGQVSKDLLVKVKQVLDNKKTTATTTTKATISPAPAPTTQSPSTKKSFNIFFLGTGELLEEDAKEKKYKEKKYKEKKYKEKKYKEKKYKEKKYKEKKYKHTLLTEYQKVIPDSVLVTGIAAGYGDYDKTDDGKYVIKNKRGALGEMVFETVGGEGHEASMRAAFGDLDKFLARNNINPNNTDIEINLAGFSRGGVSCLRFANRLRFIYPNLKVNLFAIDPVPGPVSKLTDDWEARNIPSNVGEYHVVHMQHVGGQGNMAYTLGFEPEDFSRLTVERPDTLVFSLDILPGLHGGAQIVRGAGMEDPAHLTAYNLHEFLRRHGAIVPPHSIKLPNTDRVTWSNFDYLTICSYPHERLKKFETMLNNEYLYSKQGTKIRALNNEMYRYHQNSDYFLTQQHREDFKAVYPNIFYWFFEGGAKDPKKIEKIKDDVINEIRNLDKIADSRLINYLLTKNVKLSEQKTEIPPQPIGNEEYPVENSPYTNHLTLSENRWIYYHPENPLLRLKNPVAGADLAHFIRELALGAIIKNLQQSLVEYIYGLDPGYLLVEPEKKQYHEERHKIAEKLLNGLIILSQKLEHHSKERCVNYLMLLLNATIVEDCDIRSSGGDHELTKMCWQVFEANGLQTILDKTIQEYIQQKNSLVNQQAQQTTVSSTTISTGLSFVDTNESKLANEAKGPSSFQSPSSFWNSAKVVPEKLEQDKAEELAKDTSGIINQG
jgi:Domain of unknown function (DUF5621)